MSLTFATTGEKLTETSRAGILKILVSFRFLLVILIILFFSIIGISSKNSIKFHSTTRILIELRSELGGVDIHRFLVGDRSQANYQANYVLSGASFPGEPCNEGSAVLLIFTFDNVVSLEFASALEKERAVNCTLSLHKRTLEKLERNISSEILKAEEDLRTAAALDGKISPNFLLDWSLQKNNLERDLMQLKNLSLSSSDPEFFLKKSPLRVFVRHYLLVFFLAALISVAIILAWDLMRRKK
jgi:hypothetical protein